MKRKVLIIGLVLGVLIVTSLVALLLLIDPIVHTSTVKISSNALKVPTKLGEADLQLKGRLSLDKFEVPNPAGYTEPVAIRFDRIEAAMPWSSAFSDEIVVSEFTIENPELTIEFQGAKTNLSVLMDNLKGDKPSEPSTSTKRFRISKLSITGAKVHFKSNLLSGGPKSLVLPPIELKDVGKDTWATVEEVIAILLRSLAASALEQGESFLPDTIKQALKFDVKKFQNKTIEDIQKQIDKKVRDLPIPDPFKRPE